MDDRDLNPQRYDEKLFKQVYNAALKAKEIEKEKKKKKQVLSILLLLLIPFFLVFSYFLIQKVWSKPKYVRSFNAQTDFKEIGVAQINSPEYLVNEEFVNSKSALLANLNTGEILYQKGEDNKLPIASLSKLFTAKIALEYLDLDDVVEVKKDWNELEEMAWVLGLEVGDRIKVSDLIETMMIISYNDAAYTLADATTGNWEEFVEIMNVRAKELGLLNTYFHNPSGLDSVNPELDGYSTVYDVYRIVKLAYSNDFIKSSMSKSYKKIIWEGGEKEIYSTNQLYGSYDIVSAKTGITDNAGGCFVAINKDGFVSIVINSDTRFEDTIKLFSILE